MAIVSDGVYQEEAARRMGIAEYFNAIIGSIHVGVRKPMPEKFPMALSRLNVSPEQAVVVSDNWETDVKGSRERRN